MAASVKHLDKTGGVQIASISLGDIIAGQVFAAQKFFVENNGDRDLLNLVQNLEQVGTNDGNSFVRFAADLVTLSKPFNLATVLSGPGAGGVFAVTGLHFYTVTATNPTGETTAGVQTSINVDDTTKKVTLTWDQVVGATGYRVFRSTVSGSFVSPSLRATIAGGTTTTFIDDGNAVVAGAPPVDNTTAGPSPNYGTPPTLGTTPLNIGTLKIGQQFIYWVGLIVPAGSSEVGNPRAAQFSFDET